MIKAYVVTLCGFDDATGKRKVFITGKRQFKNNQQLQAFREKNFHGMLMPKTSIISEKDLARRIVLNPEKL